MLRAIFGRRSTARPANSEEDAILREVRSGGARAERIVLTRNRRVMASVTDRGRTIRLHETFRTAPSAVLIAVGVLFSARSARIRERARAEIRSFLAEAVPPAAVARAHPRRPVRPHPGDLPHLSRLTEEFARINATFFGGRLPEVPLRLSGRMRRRNGQFSTEPLEIAIARTLCERGAEGEAERTLRHEMIHLWQWAEGRKPGHGGDFRRWARRLDIHPRATRTVCWVDEDQTGE